jgi:hypothetical protein
MFDRKEYYQKTKEKQKAKTKLWKENNKVKTKIWEEDNKEKRKETNLKYRLKNKEKLSKKNKLDAQRLKKEVMAAYGGCCSCCGETILDFLTIDHINNDGAEQRRVLKHSSGTQFYNWLKRNKS